MDIDNTLNAEPFAGQRSVTYQFNLIDGQSGERKGELHPSSTSTPTLSHDSASTISRKVQGLTLLNEEAAEFLPLIDEIEILMYIDNLDPFPLGRYLATDDVQIAYSDGMNGYTSYERPLALFDRMLIFESALSDSFDSGDMLVGEAIRRLVEMHGIAKFDIASTDQTSVAGWPIGSAGSKVLTELATAGGYLKPWFDHTDTLRVVQAINPADEIPSVDWDTHRIVISDSVTQTNETVSAPNRFIVISNDTGTSKESYVGIYDIPASAPHSIAQRGRIVPKVVDAQVKSEFQAMAYARAIGIQQTIAERIDVSTLSDPRHDGYTVVRYLGQQWLEISWSLSLAPGGVMQHTLRRTYPVVEEGN